MVYFFRIGLYFFNSRRPVVFLRFFVVIYLDIPGIPLALCSVHSNITCTRLPFAFFAIAVLSYLEGENFDIFEVKIACCFCLLERGVDANLVYGAQRACRKTELDPHVLLYPEELLCVQVNLKLAFGTTLRVGNVVSYLRLFL